MLMQIIFLAAGFALLVKGADWFVDGASAIAEKLRVPQLIIGLTVVAMGTSAPEAAISISAALKGSADITIGNIVGSNILNILIILGLSAVLSPLAVDRGTIFRDLPFLIGISLLLLAQGWDGSVNIWDGILQLILFAAYLTYLVVKAKRPPQQNTAPSSQQNLRRIPLTAVGLAAVVLGSNLAVDAACAIARLLGMSERFIGLTIVALGTSLPELFTSVTAAQKGNADIAIGNIVGSNIFNILFVIGVSAVIVPVPFAEAFRFDSLAAAGAAVFLLICCAKKPGILKRRHGFVMLAGYLAYFLAIL